jgi:hypothetical protein
MVAEVSLSWMLINFQCPHCGHFWAGPWPLSDLGDLALLPKKALKGHPLQVPCQKAACLAAHLDGQGARGRKRRKRQPAAQPAAGGAG